MEILVQPKPKLISDMNHSGSDSSFAQKKKSNNKLHLVHVDAIMGVKIL